MDTSILSRESLCRDADLAAQRAVLHGCEQHNPHPEGTEAHAVWSAHYARMLDFYADEEAEGCA